MEETRISTSTKTTRPKARQQIDWQEFRELRGSLNMPNPALAVAANLGWYAGLRVTEMTKLTWGMLGELDTLTRRMQLPAEITKNRQARTIPIALPLARALLLHMKYRDALGNKDSNDDTVLTRLNSIHPITARAIQKSFCKAATRKGLGRVTPHTLRHTFATRLLTVSSTRLVQLALGHRSITTTELYTHPTIDEIELAMARAFTEEP